MLHFIDKHPGKVVSDAFTIDIEDPTGVQRFKKGKNQLSNWRYYVPAYDEGGAAVGSGSDGAAVAGTGEAPGPGAPRQLPWSHADPGMTLWISSND